MITFLSQSFSSIGGLKDGALIDCRLREVKPVGIPTAVQYKSGKTSHAGINAYELNSTRTPMKMGHENSPSSWPIELNLAVWFYHELIQMLN